MVRWNDLGGDRTAGGDRDAAGRLEWLHKESLLEADVGTGAIPARALLRRRTVEQ